MRYRRPSPLILAASLGALAAPLAAQTSPWLDRGQPTAVWAELLYPSFKDADGFSALFLHLGARFAVGSGLRVVVELPLATSSVDDDFFGEDDGALLGNPYLGLETTPSSSGPRFSIGLRPPVVGDDAPLMTALASLIADYDRIEAYMPDMWTFRAEGARRWTLSNGLLLDLGLASVVLVPTEGDVEVLADYRLGAGIASSGFEALVSVHGRWAATAEDASFAEASVHQLTLSGSLVRSRLRPTLFFRLPLDDELKDGLSMVIGIGATLSF